MEVSFLVEPLRVVPRPARREKAHEQQRREQEEHVIEQGVRTVLERSAVAVLEVLAELRCVIRLIRGTDLAIKCCPTSLTK